MNDTVFVLYNGNKEGTITGQYIVRNGIYHQSFSAFITSITGIQNPGANYYNNIEFSCNNSVVRYSAITDDDFMKARSTNKIVIGARIVCEMSCPQPQYLHNDSQSSLETPITQETGEVMRNAKEEVADLKKMSRDVKENIKDSGESDTAKSEFETSLEELIEILKSLNLEDVRNMQDQDQPEISKKLSLLASKFLK